jgi:hypothetical protein
MQNLLINAAGEVAANEIGNLAHETKIINDYTGEVVAIIPSQISKVQQLTLHAMLGCGMAAAGGNNCAAGAASGVMGEVSAEFLDKNTILGNKQILESSKLIGALTSASIVGADDGDSVFAGSQIARNAAQNNALQIKAQKVAGTKNHLTVVHTPEADEQALYANKDGYVQDKESGLWIRTWGAGPENPAAGFLSEVTDMVGTDLLSKPNRDRDVDLSIKNYTSPNLVPPSQEGRYVQLLNNLDLNYQDNLKYDLFPNLNPSSGYNSNSYVSGLLIAAKIAPPSIPDKKINYQWQGWEYNNTSPINIEYRFPFQVPGYDKPVPSRYFKAN